MEKTMKLRNIMIIIILCVLMSLSASSACLVSYNPPSTPITLLHNNEGAVCLDGSPPSYYFDAGEGDGINNWIVYLQGGGWCITPDDCLGRTTKNYGSSKHAVNAIQLGQILSKSSIYNPDFCNWNRVFVNYCDGSSFTGDVEAVDPAYNLTYRGGRIFKVIMDDLLSKGMKNAKNAILSGSSAGGVATVIHCDRFKFLLSSVTKVKCFCDSGNFVQDKYLMGAKTFDSSFQALISLHGSTPNLPPTCIAKSIKPSLCFFLQYILPGLMTPIFMAMSTFDQIQIQYNLSPEHDKCLVHENCTSFQMAAIQGLRLEFLHTLPLALPPFRGIWLTSCVTHDLIARGWIPPNDQTKPSNLVYSKAFGDWFYERLAANVVDISDVAKNCTDLGIGEF